MNLQNGYIEEDVFPKIFTHYEERPYGILFYNEANRDSYDSNHAVIYRDKIDDLKTVIDEIKDFYGSRNLRTILYQAMTDNGWFEEISGELAGFGFKSWTELQEYMLPTGVDRIVPNPELKVTLNHPHCWMFAAKENGKTIGVIYGHVSDIACRVDYLLVSKKHRGVGAGRALFHTYNEWCKQSGIDKAYLWPDGETARRIYMEGGYEPVEKIKAGRAVLKTDL